MLVGVLPFQDEDQQQVLQNIVKREILEWKYLKTILDADSVDIIETLLRTHPQQRPTIQQIKQHQFFQSIDFDKIFDIPPPRNPYNKPSKNIS